MLFPLTQIVGTGLRAGASVEVAEISTLQEIKRAQREISIIK
jgi:hypothetical protein